ncbi:MAG: putative adenylyltransferase/sulfurtransferase MoeZ [Firmicutes bacterium]|nr:putative adenylyltransferase/sulfurtransferase MoeZ [Bacillota bacterium]
MSTLSPLQIKRYHRNTQLPGVGDEGQLKLLQSSVLVVGAGGLGSPAAYYLAAAGIGRLGIADSDVVELSNLQRQILHFTADIGRPKVISAADKLVALNPDCHVVTYHCSVTAENAADLVSQYDLVVDATDNFPSRFVLNKACLVANKPFIHAAVLSMAGRVMTILPNQGPCLRCVFREPPAPSAKTTFELGVLGAIPGLAACIQASETIKYLLGLGDLLVNRLLIFDALAMSFEVVEVLRDTDCPDCGSSAQI